MQVNEKDFCDSTDLLETSSNLKNLYSEEEYTDRKQAVSDINIIQKNTDKFGQPDQDREWN